MMIRHAPLLAAVLLAACSGAPRTTTPDERATMLATLTTVETALGVLHATGKIPTSDYSLALGQVADLRAAVAASETTPVTAADLLARITALAAAWAIQTGSR